MSPRGRPVSRPPSLSASGPISVTPRSSHPTDSSRSARARSASGLIDVHARASPVRVPAPALFERCSTNRCRHVPSGSTCGRRLRTYATGAIAVPSPPHIPLACRAHQSECGRTPLARGHHQGGTQPMTPHKTGSTTTKEGPSP